MQSQFKTDNILAASFDKIINEITDYEGKYNGAFNSIITYILQRSLITDQTGKRSQQDPKNDNIASIANLDSMN